MTDWLRLESTTGGIHLYPLPDVAGDAGEQAWVERGRLVAELRDRHGIPEAWMEDPDRGNPTQRWAHGGMRAPTGKGWDVAVIGPPHQTLLDVATVHDTCD